MFMTPENINPELLSLLEGESKAAKIGSLIAAMGLDQRVVASADVSKTGKSIVRLRGSVEMVADPGAVDNILDGDMPCLFRLLENCFVKDKGNFTATDLLERENFSKATLSNVALYPTVQGNEVLTKMQGLSGEVVPFTFGSTSGLNFAEVLESSICAQQAGEKLGRETVVLFGTDGHESSHADEMLEDSLKIIPSGQVAEFEQFSMQLGKTLSQQRVDAAKLLLGNFMGEVSLPVFVEETLVTKNVGERFTLGKLLLLAKLAGSDPVLFKGRLGEEKSSRLLAKEGINGRLGESVASQNGEMAGFGYYAREAVLAADFAGVVIYPLKLTTHANIYKILDSYGGLFSPDTNTGAILCPISRHRIQTRAQARENSDPCDVVVLAFLASKFPEQFAKLVADFKKSCVVLSPEEAIAAGTRDTRFIVEEYFQL